MQKRKVRIYPFVDIIFSRTYPTAAQQGAAPDRLQLRSFLTSLPAAGELGVRPLRDIARRVILSNMSKHDLQHFESGLKSLIGDDKNIRPFVCEGSPLACQAFIVGFNPATELTKPFWDFWNSDYGFSKSEWFENYKRERQDKPLASGKTRRATISNTRRVIDWITEAALPVPCLETNLYALATSQATDLATQDRSTEIFDFLLREISPKVLLLHGKDAEQHLKGLLVSAQVITVPHLSRGWSKIKAKEIGEQIRKACMTTKAN